MADIVERWMWQSPGDIIERLISRSAAQKLPNPPPSGPRPPPPPAPPRDRYYTQARRVHVKRLMKGKL